jgi:hypothetical protein
MKITLDDWQEEILKYDGDFLLCTGRQIGKTTIMAIKSAEYMINHPASKIIIVSLTEDQAKLIIVMILDYLERNYKNYIAKGKDKPTQNKIVLKNKSTALARPVGSTGDSIRGFTGSVLIIDEASRMPELAFVAGEPTLMTTGGQVWMCSTPHGKEGYFWRAFNDPENWKIFYKSSEDVVYNRQISESWTEEKREKAIKRLEKQKQTMSEISYGQEYMGLFLDDLRRLFTEDIINKVLSLEKSNIIIGKTYLGVDCAGMGEDKNSFEVIDKLENDKIRQLDNITTKKEYTTQTTNRIIELHNNYHFKKIGVDDGGVGFGVFSELLNNPHTKDRVVALNNSRRPLDSDNKAKKRILKEDMYFNLLNLMEKGKIKLLKDPDIRLSLASVQIEEKDNKTFIFGKDTHIVEGLIRACWLASQDKTLNLWAR